MKEFIKLPGSELELMLIIWNLGGRVSTSDIMDAMQGKKTVQVVQTYLGRLESKGFVEREKLGRLNFYKPLIEKEHYRASETRQFMSRFYNSSSSRLFASLLKNNQMSPQELDEIKKLIEKGGE